MLLLLLLLLVPVRLLRRLVLRLRPSVAAPEAEPASLCSRVGGGRGPSSRRRRPPAVRCSADGGRLAGGRCGSGGQSGLVPRGLARSFVV